MFDLAVRGCDSGLELRRLKSFTSYIRESSGDDRLLFYFMTARFVRIVRGYKRTAVSWQLSRTQDRGIALRRGELQSPSLKVLGS